MLSIVPAGFIAHRNHRMPKILTTGLVIVGVLYVAEDGGDMQIVLVRPDGSTFPVVQVTGVANSEMCGPAFSPDGTRLYFSSQRNPGTTYEVTGPWSAFNEPGPFNP